MFFIVLSGYLHAFAHTFLHLLEFVNGVLETETCTSCVSSERQNQKIKTKIERNGEKAFIEYLEYKAS